MTESELITLTSATDSQSIMDSLTMPGFWLITILVGVIIALALFSYQALRDYRAVVNERDELFDITRAMDSNLSIVTSQLEQVRRSLELLENEYSEYRTSSDGVIDKLVDQAQIV